MLVRSVVAILAILQCLSVSSAWGQAPEAPSGQTVTEQGAQSVAEVGTEPSAAGSEGVPAPVELARRSHAASVPATSVLEPSVLDADSPGLLPPLVGVASGAAITAVGVGLGAIPTLVCEGECEVSNFAGPTVVAGAAILAMALVWLDWVVEARAEDRRSVLGSSAGLDPTFRF